MSFSEFGKDTFFKLMKLSLSLVKYCFSIFHQYKPMKDQPLTKFLQLPFQFDVKKLQKELAVILQSNWIPHFNSGGYTGNWNSIALYSQTGESTKIFALPNIDGPLKETPILQTSLYLKEVIQTFKTNLYSVRLLRLEIGAYIKPHRDYNCGYEDNIFRIHIPIITNPEVEFILDDERLEMLEGQCWYTNVNYIHSVANKGNRDRIHLVIDGKRNSWSDDLFFSLAPKESFFPKQEPKSHSLEVMEKMLVGLRSMNTEGAERMVKDLELKIKTLKDS